MSKPLVYLAGPITGQTWIGTTDWREEASHILAGFDIIGVSPLRGKEYLKEETNIADTYEDTILSTAKSIFARDFHDVQRCDALLVNFLGATKVSIGTVMEITYAWSLRKPVVVVMDEQNIHYRAMLCEASSFIVPTMDDGIFVLHNLFS